MVGGRTDRSGTEVVVIAHYNPLWSLQCNTLQYNTLQYCPLQPALVGTALRVAPVVQLSIVRVMSIVFVSLSSLVFICSLYLSAVIVNHKF